MIDGSAREFIDGLYFGDERFFVFNGCKYFVQGYTLDGKRLIELYILEPSDSDFKWVAYSSDNHYPVKDFENAKIFDGKSFWEIENSIKWVDA